jgi:hypothetical protein
MLFLRDSSKVPILDKESFAFQKLIYLMYWLESSYTGFIPERVLELKFNGNRSMG